MDGILDGRAGDGGVSGEAPMRKIGFDGRASAITIIDQTVAVWLIAPLFIYLGAALTPSMLVMAAFPFVNFAMHAAIAFGTGLWDRMAERGRERLTKSGTDP